MPFLTGAPTIEPTDYDTGRLADYTPSLGEHVGSAFSSNYELNPTRQAFGAAELGTLEAGPKSYIDELGNEVQIYAGLDPNDPRARRMSLDEANTKGAEMGLRFSEPPTQGQFDYLAKLKQKENSNAETLSHAPLVSGRTAIGFTAGLAASIADPINIATSVVPIVGEARYANMVRSIGRTGARLSKGAIEGGVGTAAVTPLVYLQAQQLQQDYDAYSALNDIVFGATLGAGIHAAGGRIKDAYRARQFNNLFRFLRENDANMPRPETFIGDRRNTRVQEGDNAVRHESMTEQDRAKVLNVAVKSLENDTVPKIDTILASDPKLADMAIPDKRFPATVKLRSSLTAADHAVGTQGASIIDMATSRRLTSAKLPQSPKGVFDLFAKRYKKLQDYALKVVPPAEFGQRVGNALEHPDQRVAIEPGSKTIVVTEGASLGAVRHEVERAMDEAYQVASADRGGYRYDHRDLDQMNAHRAAMGQHIEEFPEQAPRTPSPREALDLFNTEPEPILGAEGPKASQHAEEMVNRDKDIQLDTIISDEEIGAIEAITDNIQGRAKDLGIMDKVIPLEERIILEEAAARQGKADQVKDLFSIADEIVEEELVGKSTSDAEILLRAGPEKLAEIITGKKSTENVIQEVADTGLVTRVNAAKDIKFYLSRIKQDLSGEAFERAIRDVQAGEDINVAVDAALPRDTVETGTLAKQAEAPKSKETTAAEQPDVGGKTSGLDDLFDDIVEEATAIIEAEKIYDKRDLALGEEKIVQEEHTALAASKKSRDLFSAVEKDEFDAANRDRALRQGDGTASGGEGQGAGLGGSRAAVATELQTAAFGRDGETARGASAATERERETPGGERSAPATAQSYGGWNVPRRVITPDSSIEVTVEPRIVELEDLFHAEGALQVRDRSRKESAVEAFDRALKLDPEQLLPNRVADAGAPIVIARPEGGYTIVSGNGRILSLRQVYGDETFGGKARQYRERIGPAADGYRRPILVSVITDTLSDQELAKFAERANRSRIAEMSATEKAQRDADVAGEEVMSLYQGGDFTKRENQAFTRAFMMKVATAQERGDMSKNGVLTKGGVDRLNAAVLAAAYDDTGVLSLMLESTDNNIKSISSAYRDVAPIFMRLRAQIGKGLVREEMDITAYMMEAARFVQKAREENIKIYSALSQVDALNPMDPIVDTLIRQFYDPQLKRANSSLRIAENLRLYAETALEKRTGGFFEDTTTARDVIAAAERRFAREADEEVIAIDDEDVGGGAESERAQAPQPAPSQPRPVVGERSAGGGQKAATRPAAKIDDRARAVIDRVGGEKAAAEIMGVPDKAEAKIRAFMDDMAKMGALDKVAPAPDTRRAELEKMKVPEIRAKAKAEGLVIKGRSKDEVIDSYLKAAKQEPIAAAPSISAPNQREVGSTLADFARVSSWVSVVDRMTTMREDIKSLLARKAFDGRPKTIVERLAKNAGELEEHVKNHRLPEAKELLGDMADDAARLSEMDSRPEARAVTQWVRSAPATVAWPR